MVILDIFSKNIEITYKCTLISKAAILVLFFGIFTIILPFILAYKSKGFWLKRDIFYEQPDVRFKGEYLFTATTNDLNQPIVCSTLSYYQKTIERFDNCATIKVREIDYNFDKLVDEVNLQLSINLPEKNHITSFTIIIPLDYRLQRQCPFRMQSFIIYQQFLPIIMSEFSVIADLNLRQIEGLNCKQKIDTIYNYSLITNENNLENYRIANIIEAYSKRNVSTILTNILTNFIIENNKNFNLILKIRIPKQQIWCKPEFWQIIKWAWIQYLSIFLLISYLINKLKLYLFNRRFVLFYVDDPLKKKQ